MDLISVVKQLRIVCQSLWNTVDRLTREIIDNEKKIQNQKRNDFRSERNRGRNEFKVWKKKVNDDNQEKRNENFYNFSDVEHHVDDINFAERKNQIDDVDGHLTEKEKLEEMKVEFSQVSENPKVKKEN